jgi:predicted DNA-binding antitoxin AbrB/MazE fold protein
MGETFEATYDGKVLHPESPLVLKPNTRVRITVESVERSGSDEERGSFLRTARSLNLEGPRDWAENLDAYLYGDARDSK